MNTLIGKVAFIKEKEQKTETFAKRVVGLLLDGNHQPQIIPFEFVNEKIKMVDTIKVNDEVRIHYTLHGSKWTNRQGETNHSATLRPQRVDNLSLPTPADAMKVFNEAGDNENISTDPQRAVDDLLTNMQ